MAIPDSILDFGQESPEFERDFRGALVLTSASAGSHFTSALTSVLNPVPLPQPLPSFVSDSPTPIAEPYFPDLGFQTIVAAAIPPRETQRHLESSLSSIQPRRLQLPSFPSLGLTTRPSLPNPCQDVQSVVQIANSLDSSRGCVVLGEIDIGLEQEQFVPRQALTTKHDEIHQHTHTPPELGDIHVDIHEPQLMSPTIQQFVFSPKPPQDTAWPICQTLGDGADGNAARSLEMEAVKGFDVDISGGTDSTSSGCFIPRPSEALWVVDMIPDLLSAIHPPDSQPSNSQIRVMTHALPLPSLEGYCFPNILTQIHALLTPQRTTWISHWHAVSGRFNISQLPTTPPSTPTPPHEGDDSFTTRVFDSAVSVPDYQHTDIRPHAQIPFLRANHGPFQSFTSPRPAVPPSSVHVSVTERYIPPTASSEFIDIFDPSSGRSLISDRLVELSENNGILIFIYPTKEGGRTFLKEYLNPVLDPLLRQMMIIRNLGIDVCQKIGTMTAVQNMPAYEESKGRLEAFCSSISASTSGSGPSLSKFRSTTGVPIVLELVHSYRREISLAPEVWSDWWCRQEKPRIRQAFDDYIRQNPGRTRSSSGVSPNIPTASRARLRDEAQSEGSNMQYILEVMEGVRKGAREKAAQREVKGIEVGVFVIRKRIAASEE